MITELNLWHGYSPPSNEQCQAKWQIMQLCISYCACCARTNDKCTTKSLNVQCAGWKSQSRITHNCDDWWLFLSKFYPQPRNLMSWTQKKITIKLNFVDQSPLPKWAMLRRVNGDICVNTHHAFYTQVYESA